MARRRWLRSPQQLVLAFFVVALASTATVAWLTWELIAQDRVAETQRRAESRERAIDTAVTALGQRLDAIDRGLDSTIDSGLDLHFPADAMLVSYAGGSLVLRPDVGLPYYPFELPSSAPIDTASMEAERLELRDLNLDAAARAYAAIGASANPAIRAWAWTRLARVHRKQHLWTSALAAYDRLAALGNTAVDGYPALLLARIGRATIFELEQPDPTSLRAEAARLAGDLAAGRLHVTSAQYTRYLAEARRWLDDDSTAGAGMNALARADALEWLWTERERLPSNGRQLIATTSGGTLVSWRISETGAVRAVLIGPDSLADLVASVVAPGLAWALTDEGRVIAGTPPPARDAAIRQPASTGLPWTLHLFASADAAPASSPRRTSLMLVLVCVGVVLGAGWFFIWRGISREARAARLQSDFVAAVSHEFRSPLTSLRHIAHMLAGDRIGSGERRARSYALLVSETERLGNLVEGLLDFGRLQAGRATFQFDPVLVCDLVAGVARDFEARLGPNDHRIDLTIEAPEATAMLDREAIGRVVWNLLDNAVKYSPGSPRVHVTVTAGSGTAQIVVRDEGLGIPADEQDAVFDRFVRGAAAKARGIGGTGIGLALAREIVHAHNGEIRVESRSGSGSTFTVVLPLAAAQAAVIDPAVMEHTRHVDEPLAR